MQMRCICHSPSVDQGGKAPGDKSHDGASLSELPLSSMSAIHADMWAECVRESVPQLGRSAELAGIIDPRRRHPGRIHCRAWGGGCWETGIYPILVMRAVANTRRR